MTILNIEADEILYRAAFAVETKGYKITLKNGGSKDLGGKYTKTKIKKMMLTKDKTLDVDYKLEVYPIVEPVSYCLRIIKNTLQRLSKHGDLRLFLTASDKSNFRFGIVETEGPKGMGYKAGRPPRPVHYEAAREYLLKQGAEEIFGYEADDALCMYQTDDTIACHIDKDINMVVGKHLNWVTMEFYDVPEGLGTVTINDKGKAVGRGLKYFYHQLLTGDATDNILGIKGIGDKTAYTILEGIETEQECLRGVVNIYATHYGEGYLNILLEMADLLWMVRKDKLTGRQYLQERLNEHTTL
jgi:hypothetical protein